jgi:hypothetical protein
LTGSAALASAAKKPDTSSFAMPRQSLLRATKNVLIFKKQSRCHQGYEPQLGNERENTVARAQLAAKSGHNHKRIHKYCHAEHLSPLTSRLSMYLTILGFLAEASLMVWLISIHT